MKFGIANLSIVPVRAEAKEQSEQKTQLLFGETFEILEKRKSWFKIESHFDNYEGWIDPKLVKQISDQDFDKINKSKKIVTNDIITIIKRISDNSNLLLPAGSTISNFYNDNSFRFADEEFEINKNISLLKKHNKRQQILNIAVRFLNSPYLWGGKTNFGIDCSGFSQIVCKICGINIPRDSYQQVNYGRTLNMIVEAQAGDLAFFDNQDGKIIHVGIMLGNNKIIHASGKVRIDTIDHQGIYNQEINAYTHSLRVITNIID